MEQLGANRELSNAFNGVELHSTAPDSRVIAALVLFLLELSSPHGAHANLADFRAALSHCAAAPDDVETGLAIVHDMMCLRGLLPAQLLDELGDRLEQMLELASLTPGPRHVEATALLGVDQALAGQVGPGGDSAAAL
ncbi:MULTISPECIES: hypothetical protein [Saccharothrix]|uniref:hypothetical protein n=1 Tax=Saccharothrix TaxID=2071 RepID=UPI00093BD32B|nr:hypothetical protein [Saccharothrix sp. CB00851]